MNDSKPEVKRSFVKSVRNYFRQYCNSTTIHGFKYFGEKRTIFERVWWAIVFTICLAVCIYSIYLVYQKWDQSPVIVSFATRSTPIFNIPFPAITICPETKFSQADFNYTHIFRKKMRNETLTPKESTLFEYTSLLCTPHFDPDFYEGNETFSDEFFTTIDRLKQGFKLISCMYLGKDQICENLFHPVLTDEGTCYSFNSLNQTDIFRNANHFNDYLAFEHTVSNWTLQNGYPDEAGIDTYPRRALIAGATKGLSFYIVSEKRDFDYICNPVQGYKVILHTATRVPRPSQQYFRLPLNQDITAAVQPVMITTSDSVKHYSPARRECYFSNERYLKYFTSYTSLNCMMECLANVTLDTCGCTAFYMPRENGTRICGTGSFECMVEAENKMYARDLKKDLIKNKKIKKNKIKKTKVKACGCLPICSDLTYDVEISQSDWDWQEIIQAYGGENSYNESVYYLSALKVYFKSNNFITSQRNELYGPTDFLANFGGLLGLFTGFSILSLMEILYFLSVRIFCNVRLYGFWAGPEM